MSSTTLYGVPPTGELEEIEEYRNGRLSAPVVWDKLCKENNIKSWIFNDEDADKLWALAKDLSVPEYKRLTLIATFDWMIIRKQDFELFIPALRQFCDYDVKELRCHFRDIADKMEDKEIWENYIGCCMRMTSVSDMWSGYYDDREDKSKCLYDISHGSKHWFYDHSLPAGGDPDLQDNT